MVSQRALLLDVSTESRLCSALQTILNSHFQIDIVREASYYDAGRFQALIRRFDPLVIFLIFSSEVRYNGEILKSVRKEALSIPIIAVIDACEPQGILELLRGGATDFLTSPLNAANVLPRTWNLLRWPSENPKQTQLVSRGHGLQALVGESPDFLVQVQKIPLIANCDANVLIEGGTGKGKEGFACTI